VPAAAVTPAPIAYINIAAVKKLVVGSQLRPVSAGSWYVLRLCRCRASLRRVAGRRFCMPAPGETRGVVAAEGAVARCPVTFTLSKGECLKQAFLPVDLGAWNNGTGPRAFVCWFPGAPR
jgi:hypothetical protein